ncbi:MAG: electron transfer flavoprotein subunit alpha/FixB family protein [Sporolactobacillus sp.]
MSTIWVITERTAEAYGLITKSKALGGESVCVFTNDEQADECYQFGATEVQTLELADHTPWEQHAVKLSALAVEKKPALILVAATKRGKTLAAYLGGLINAPVLTEVKSLDGVDGQWVVTRTIYGGMGEKTLAVSADSTTIVSVSPGMYEGQKIAAQPQPVGRLQLDQTDTWQVVSREKKPTASVNLSDASVVVGVGRGFGSKDNIKYAEKLATLLNGEVACSRPVTEDLNWMPEERYVGISGQVIKPDLYLCAGVSGQIQHVYGVRDAKRIVAINKDEKAPIFKVADYYIVGDLNEVLPEMIKVLQ